MENGIDVFESLKIQRDQLTRLLAAKSWISEAPRATAEEMAAQVAQLKLIIAQLEQLINQSRK